jgi:hemoglobin
MRLYETMGGAAGCHALSTAFYARVERDPVLRPLFPTTFTCAIAEFAAFLVQFLGGEAEHTQGRWWLSLRESHDRFAIGPRERAAWLRAMTETLNDETAIGDAAARTELLQFFRHSSSYVIHKEPAEPLHGELAPLWDEQAALDGLVGLLRSGAEEQCLELLRGSQLRARFARSPAVHASVVSLAAKSKKPLLREYAMEQLNANPSLVHERYSGNRTLLHDACGAGDLELVESLIGMGAGRATLADRIRSPLYCVGNECLVPGGGEIVRTLLRHRIVPVNAVHGVKRCTALHMAARRGTVEVIEALLEGGADIEARDSAGDTPLRRAVNCNRVEAARVLLARGANAHSIGSKSLTPKRAARSAPMMRIFGG